MVRSIFEHNFLHEEAKNKTTNFLIDDATRNLLMRKPTGKNGAKYLCAVFFPVLVFAGPVVNEPAPDSRFAISHVPKVNLCRDGRAIIIKAARLASDRDSLTAPGTAAAATSLVEGSPSRVPPLPNEPAVSGG